MLGNAPALKPASKFSPDRCPRLRRMTDAPPTGAYSINYFFTPKAAAIIEENPEILLHTRLYRREERVFSLYERGDRAICAVLVQLRTLPFSPQFKLLPLFPMSLIDNIIAFAPEELPEHLGPRKVQLADEYPAPFLPFDLDRIKRGIERRIAIGDPNEDGRYASRENPSTIFVSSCPFAVYQTFYYLTHYRKVLASKIAGIRQMLDVGGGLGIVSFIISQLLPHAQVRSIEIDQKLVDCQHEMKDELGKLDYSFRNAVFTLDNILFLKGCKIEDFDAAIGWFPISASVPNDRFVEVFQRMKRGALLFLLFKGRLFPQETAETFGFRHIPIESEFPLPVTIYERV